MSNALAICCAGVTLEVRFILEEKHVNKPAAATSRSDLSEPRLPSLNDVERNCTIDSARRCESCWGIAELSVSSRDLKDSVSSCRTAPSSVLSGQGFPELGTGLYQRATMFGGNNHNRKYVDLIFQSRGKYPNLDPTTSMEVGDYGFVTRDAMFRKQGNLFKENLAQGLVEETGARMDIVVMMAKGTNSLDASGNVGAYVRSSTSNTSFISD